MKVSSSRLQWMILASAVTFFGSVARAQQYLYTNDNVANKINSTTALKVGTSGKATIIKTYTTGAKSAGGGSYYASQPIAYAETTSASCLFVSNGGDSSIAAFKISVSTGKLTAIKGSPFSYGIVGSQPSGVSLASGNGKLLFAGNSKFNSISVLKIGADCSLTSSGSVSLSYSPVDLKATPNGKYLISTYMGPVDSFSIDYSKAQLTELGPFSSSGSAAGVDITCDGTTAFFGDAAAHTEVQTYRIETNGSLKKLGKFTNKNGSNSNNVLIGKDQKTLYVTNNQSNQVSVLAISDKGVKSFQKTINLTSPGQFSGDLAENKAGTQVFVSEARNPESVGVLAVNGYSLKEVPGSPFEVVSNGFAPAGIVAVPTFACK